SSRQIHSRAAVLFWHLDPGQSQLARALQQSPDHGKILALDRFAGGSNFFLRETLRRLCDQLLLLAELLRSADRFWHSQQEPAAHDAGIPHGLENQVFDHCCRSLPAAHAQTDQAQRFRRRRNSLNNVARSLAPVQPSGCPSAIAPPFTLTRSGSKSSAAITASAWQPNASFNSITSISFNPTPARFSALGIAATGPMPIISGATPAVAYPASRASGRKCSSRTRLSDAISAAAAPSLICEEFPAVTVPWARNAGLSAASAAGCVSARGSSSRVTTVSRQYPSASASGTRVATGAISSSNRPSACAAAALRWLCSAKSSAASRDILCSRATRSAVKPMLRYDPGRCSISQGFALGLLPTIGTMLMLSAPPASTACAPLATRSHPIATASNPDAQNRFTVAADASTGIPARSAEIRATLSPCSASGMAQPRITSSTTPASTCARSSAAVNATAARSSGRVARNAPFGALQTAVRTLEM